MANNIYFGGTDYNVSSNACVFDITPPSFSGVSSLVAQPNGSLRATWTAATDASSPVRYNIYVSTSAGDIYTKLIGSVNGLTVDIFQSTTGLLQYNTTYYVAVRAVDAVGNINTNVVTLSAISSGVSIDSTYNLLQQILNKEDKIINSVYGLY
jgi:hypothetical protein